MRRIYLDRTRPGTHMHTKTPSKDRRRARPAGGTRASSRGLDSLAASGVVGGVVKEKKKQ